MRYILKKNENLVLFGYFTTKYVNSEINRDWIGEKSKEIKMPISDDSLVFRRIVGVFLEYFFRKKENT